MAVSIAGASALLLLLSSLSRRCVLAQNITTPTTSTTSTTPTTSTTSTTPTTPTTPATTGVPGITTAVNGWVPCACDLSQGGCDVGCCCDTDCSSIICLQSRLARVCIPNSTFFKHNTPYSLDNSRPGLACITQNDFFCRNFYLTPRNITDFDGEVLRSGVGALFPRMQPTAAPHATRSYRVGEPIEIVTNSNLRARFSLPVPVSPTGICGGNGPVGFRMDTSVSCLRFINDLNKTCTSGSFLDATRYNNMAFLKVFLNETADFHGQSIFTTGTQSQLVNNTASCENAMTAVRFEVKYNASSGDIYVVNVIVVNANLTHLNTSLLQEFKVSFISSATGSTTAVSQRKRSGNPGYLWDYPLLGITNTSEVIQVFLPANDNCFSQRRPAPFGTQVFTGCTLRLDMTDCMAMQVHVFKAWLGDLTQSYPEHVTEWGDAMDGQAPSVPILGLQKIKTDVMGSNFTTLCELVLSAHLNVLWSLDGTLENPQKRVVGAQIIPGQRLNVMGESIQKVWLTLSFTDVTPPRAVTPPTDDFFLPFMQGRT